MMWRIAIFFLAGLALVGCRTDPNVPVLERELRLQEDKIYQLEDQLAEHRAALEACRNHSVAPAPAAGLPAPPPADVVGPALTPGGPQEPVATQPPIVELPGRPQTQIPETLQVPKDAPPSLDRPKSPPATKQPNDGPAPATEPGRPGPSAGRTWQKASPTGQVSERSRPAATAPQLSQGPVQRILLNPALTGGLNADGKPGDEGLTVLIEPQDGQGRSVSRTAPVSVVVLDRQAHGQTARVARWDFTAEQVAQRMRRTSVGSGIYLELPWPSQAPAHGDLQVYVRYAADDSHQFEADMPVTVELPGQPKQWTAAQPGTKKTVAAAAPSAVPAPIAAKPAAPARVDQPTAGPAPSAPTQTLREKRRSPSRSEVRRPVWSPNR